MANYRPKSTEPKDYKERFEFCLTVGDNIICQRYFKINGFNPLSTSSVELASVMEDLATKIDNDLKEKSDIYLELTVPRFFGSVEEMNKYFENPEHRAQMHLGEGIVIREKGVPNHFWSKTGPRPLEANFLEEIKEGDFAQYKLAFLVDGKEVCACVWDGIYPKYVRNSVDLSNTRGTIEEGVDPTQLPFNEYMNYKFTLGRTSLVYAIISNLQATCSQDSKWYQTTLQYGDKVYDLNIKKYNEKLFNKDRK